MVFVMPIEKRHMKQLLILLLPFLFACKSNTIMQDDGLTGRWKLTEILNPWTNETKPSSILEYQEFYEFGPDNSVKKFRTNGEEARGKYEYKEQDNGLHIEITYEDPRTPLKASCYEKEFITILDNQLKGGSMPCDGPGLTYEKVKNKK